MNIEDKQKYIEKFPIWKSRFGVNPINICLLSANNEQNDIVVENFPGSKIFRFSRENWDLNHKIDRHFDLIAAMNVFHYSPDPRLWFENVMNSCKVFWIQDIIDRVRGNGTISCQYGWDGDCRRYSYGGYRSLNTESFNIEDLLPQYLVKNFECYPAYSKDHPQFDNRNFIAEIIHAK